MVRFLPLAIWGTKTKIGKEKQIRDILELDGAFTHPSPLVLDASFILGVTVNYLLNNIDYEDRAQSAFEEAMSLSTRQELVYSPSYISTWLEQAEDLCSTCGDRSLNTAVIPCVHATGCCRCHANLRAVGIPMLSLCRGLIESIAHLYWN